MGVSALPEAENEEMPELLSCSENMTAKTRAKSIRKKKMTLLSLMVFITAITSLYTMAVP